MARVFRIGTYSGHPQSVWGEGNVVDGGEYECFLSRTTDVVEANDVNLQGEGGREGGRPVVKVKVPLSKNQTHTRVAKWVQD